MKKDSLLKLPPIDMSEDDIRSMLYAKQLQISKLAASYNALKQIELVADPKSLQKYQALEGLMEVRSKLSEEQKEERINIIKGLVGSIIAVEDLNGHERLFRATATYEKSAYDTMIEEGDFSEFDFSKTAGIQQACCFIKYMLSQLGSDREEEIPELTNLFRRMLESYPEWKGNIIYLENATGKGMGIQPELKILKEERQAEVDV